MDAGVKQRGAIVWLLLAVTLFAASGASCPRAMQQPAATPAPVAFYGQPTLEQIVRVVNANTSRVQQLQSTSGTLSISGLPSLQANLALERPRRFRLQAGLGISGTELDLGSNDELFWFWAKRNQPPAVYYARHDQFRGGVASQVLPLPPQWLITALGLIELQPTSEITGPYIPQPGQLEIHTVDQTVSGTLRRVILLDDQYGHVLEQRVYNLQGQLLATALASDYHYDTASGASLPRTVQIQLPPAQIAFTLQMEDYLVNQLYADAAQLWSLPRLNGYQYTDLMQMTAP